jgi:hypothetical protein
MGNQTATSNALIGFSAIATQSVERRNKAEHMQYQRLEGLMAEKIANCLKKSIEPGLRQFVGKLICRIFVIVFL